MKIARVQFSRSKKNAIHIKMKSKFFTVFVSASILCSCKKENTGAVSYITADPAPNPTKRELEADLKQDQIEMSDLARRLEPILDVSVAEKWNIEEWESRFGNPKARRQVSPELLIFGYYERGSPPINKNKKITGVDIWMKNGITHKWEWHITTFGE